MPGRRMTYSPLLFRIYNDGIRRATDALPLSLIRLEQLEELDKARNGSLTRRRRERAEATAEVKRLHDAGLSNTQIAQQLCMSRSTVRRYLQDPS